MSEHQPTTKECSICIEKFNRSNRLCIKCQYCDYEACRDCCQTYLLQELTPKCMSNTCNRDWTRQFIADKFTKSFINKDYKKHRENVLFDRERSLMPATQAAVEIEQRRDSIQNEMMQVRKIITEARYRMSVLNNQLYRIHRPISSGAEAGVERRVFVRACPASECRGFLSTQWKCGICQIWACPNCHVIKGLERDAEHTCNENDLATARLLAENTKMCPNCSTGIFKIDGCDQMFCTSCNTPFNWRTGEIIRSNIHNPHYFEWIRRNRENNIELPHGNAAVMEHRCNMADINAAITLTRTVFRRIQLQTNNQELKDWLNDGKVEHIYNIYRNITHLNHEELPRFATTGDTPIRINQLLRIKYMRNMITEEKFKTLLQQSDKRHQKKQEIYNVLQMASTTFMEIANRLYNTLNEASQPDTNNDGIIERLNTFDVEFEALRNYVNECLTEIADTYQSKVYHLSESLYLQALTD